MNNSIQDGKTYAGIRQRIAAYLLDYVLLFCALMVMQALIWALGNGFPYTFLKNGIQIELWIMFSISLPVWLYFALSEHSSQQATIGKRIFQLQVTHISGKRIGFGRALLRTALKLLPWELTHFTLLVPVPMWWEPNPEFRFGLIVVYVLIGIYLVVMLLNKRRQSVHDLLANTVVIKTGQKLLTPE